MESVLITAGYTFSHISGDFLLFVQDLNTFRYDIRIKSCKLYQFIINREV